VLRAPPPATHSRASGSRISCSKRGADQGSANAVAATAAVSAMSARAARETSITRHLDLEAAPLSRQALAGDPDRLGGAGDVPVVLPQPGDQELALEILAGRSQGDSLDVLALLAIPEILRQILDADLGPRGHQHQGL